MKPNFATDRDLLTIEPGVFRDAGWTAQRRLTGQGFIAGGLLRLDSHDASLQDVAPDGAVIRVGGVLYEVLEVVSNAEAVLSRPRPSAASPALPPPEVDVTSVELVSFEAQLLWAQDQALAMLGLNADQSDLVMNPWVLRRLIVLGTLHLVFAAAGAGLPEDAPINQRARDYRLRYAHERARITVEIDLDGDGVPDVLRRPWLVSLRRA